ncbi:MAG: AraC family transcriptional regulator [Proteobacteria bacterium]|nr:MAG: AraC family transcriptional regulator [Pseudomonadota bacterium]QKK11013.1 MAG: helix-turn-helix transcriptional regulator [Pseudomonadota bacterium]
MTTENTPIETSLREAFAVPDDSIDVEAVPRPVTFRSRDYDGPHIVAMHTHRRAQLLYASRGVMQVHTPRGIWVVPPQRAVWLPPATEHAVSSPGPLALRNLYFEPGCCAELPAACCVVTVSPLLRELILYAVSLEPLYDEAGAAGRLMQVIVDQIKILPIAPLHLPLPEEPRIRSITLALQHDPADTKSLEEWGHRVGASARTLARLFQRETGYTFGQWRQQVRLLAALEGLAQGQSVAAVAAGLGYEKQSAFIAMFKKALGKTPGRFFD